MDNQEYLNQISMKPEAAQPNKKGIGGLLGSKVTWFLVGAVGLFIVFAIIGAVLSANKGSTKEDTIWLQLHLSSASEVISEYQPLVKSSVLRSNSASLSTVITDTNSKITKYLTEKYSYKVGSDKDLAEQIKTEQDAVSQELFEAKITGVLDRIYAHKMAYEISKLLAEETKIYNETGDDALKEIVGGSYNSLKNLYNNFNDFSEGS